MICSQVIGLKVLLKKIFEILSLVLCMHGISWGLNFCMPEKQWRTHFWSKHYKTTLVDLFTLSNFAFINFFQKWIQLGDNWAQIFFGKYPTVEKRGWQFPCSVFPESSFHHRNPAWQEALPPSPCPTTCQLLAAGLSRI